MENRCTILSPNARNPEEGIPHFRVSDGDPRRRRVDPDGALGAPHDASGTRTLPVTDPGLAGTEAFGAGRGILEEASLEYAVYRDIEPTAAFRVETVGAVHADYERNGCDSLLAFGGGSTIDTAKGAAGPAEGWPEARSPSPPHGRVLPSSRYRGHRARTALDDRPRL